jgi:hypothetical protein
MRKLVSLILIATLFLNSGCCSIFTSGPQKISVDSKPQGAKVKIGQYKGMTPYEVWMPRGKDYVIEVTYGNKTDSQALGKSIEPVYWVNILLWPGLIIDLATGSMFRYDPLHYEFTFDQ